MSKRPNSRSHRVACQHLRTETATNGAHFPAQHFFALTALVRIGIYQCAGGIQLDTLKPLCTTPRFISQSVRAPPLSICFLEETNPSLQFERSHSFCSCAAAHGTLVLF
jgi:hypothetical protein